MSSFDVSKRFEKELLSSADYLQISLPIIRDGNEVLFMFDTSIMETKILLNSIEKVFLRNIITNEIKTVQIFDFIPVLKLDFLKIPFPSKTVLDYINVKNRYYEKYEDLLNINFSNPIPRNLYIQIKDIYDCFCKLVPEGSLRTVYFLIAPDFFNYINQKINE